MVEPGGHFYCSPFYFSMRVISPKLLCHPAFWEEEDELAYSFQFLYLVSRQNPASMGQCPPASGPWLTGYSRQDWEPGLAQHTPGSPMGAVQALASRVIQADEGKQNPGEPPPHGPQGPCSVAIFSGNLVTEVGLHLPLHPRSGAGSQYRILSS